MVCEFCAYVCTCVCTCVHKPENAIVCTTVCFSLPPWAKNRGSECRQDLWCPGAALFGGDHSVGHLLAAEVWTSSNDCVRVSLEEAREGGRH